MPSGTMLEEACKASSKGFSLCITACLPSSTWGMHAFADAAASAVADCAKSLSRTALAAPSLASAIVSCSSFSCSKHHPILKLAFNGRVPIHVPHNPGCNFFPEAFNQAARTFYSRVTCTAPFSIALAAPSLASAIDLCSSFCCTIHQNLTSQPSMQTSDKLMKWTEHVCAGQCLQKLNSIRPESKWMPSVKLHHSNCTVPHESPKQLLLWNGKWPAPRS